MHRLLLLQLALYFIFPLLPARELGSWCWVPGLRAELSIDPTGLCLPHEATIYYPYCEPWDKPRQRETFDFTIPTEAGRIKRSLEEDTHDVWGFVIYRTTYDDDDAAWDEFKDLIATRARDEMLESDAPEILDKFEWKFFEDRERFENASTGVLREDFKQWVSENWQREQPRATHPPTLYTPRYTHFLRVDQEALDSVLAFPKNHPDESPWYWRVDAGHLDFIDSEWTPQMDEVDEETEWEDMPDLDFEPIEGCQEEDVGWMRVPAESICVDLFSMIGHSASLWDVVYRRPPEVADV